MRSFDLKKPLPKHVAIIMDGNGRWAKKRGLPRIEGHRRAIDSVRTVVRMCGELKVQALTLYCFSSENWQRPQDEVKGLMSLFLKLLTQEVKSLHKNQVKLQIIGDKTPFSDPIKEAMNQAEVLTKDNRGLRLNLALNYGGRWDITEAVKAIALKVQAGELELDSINEALVGRHICLSDLPDPDLLIRTSGEQRISNFLTWQTAYTELYFTPVFWPDFKETQFEDAIEYFQNRERRFGMTTEQVKGQASQRCAFDYLEPYGVNA